MLLLALLLLTGIAPVDTLDAHYRVYTSTGVPTSFDAIVEAIPAAEVVFVGENHNDPVAHAVELWTLEAAFNAPDGRPTALSLEMFARDEQYIVDEYLDGLIPESHFTSSTSPWTNYEQDYRPLVEFARENGMAVVAANAPRRYASLVTRNGREALFGLSDHARSHLAPLPYGQPSVQYRAEWDEIMSEAAHGPMENMLQAQALWDATMAYSIAEHMLRNPITRVVHMVGGFHVESGTGTPEHLAAYRPGTPVLIISVQPVDDIEAFNPAEHAGLGDFIILSDAALPRSY